MKKLVFVRHGKAEDPSPEVSDFVRSLTPEGKIIARTMAGRLLEKDNSSAIIITSPAFRALETAIIFGAESGIKPDMIRLDSNIYYNMSFKYVYEILSAINEETERVILFGHNPSFSDIANSLCRQGCDFLPKCGIAGISFKIMTWSDLKLSSGKLDYFLKPE